MRVFKPEPGEKLLTIAEAADVAGYAPAHISNYLIGTGIIEVCHQQGDPKRRRMVREADILAWRDRETGRIARNWEAFQRWKDANRELLAQSQYGTGTALWEKFMADTGVEMRRSYFVRLLYRAGHKFIEKRELHMAADFIRAHPDLMYGSVEEAVNAYYELTGQRISLKRFSYARSMYKKTLVSHPDDGRYEKCQK